MFGKYCLAGCSLPNRSETTISNYPTVRYHPEETVNSWDVGMLGCWDVL